jgi:hypothetical protein
MSNIHIFPGRKQSHPTPPVEKPWEPQRSSLAQMRSMLQSAQDTEARTPFEAELLPYYGTVAQGSNRLPFLLRVGLNFTGSPTNLRLPNGRSFWANMPELAQAENRGGLLKDRVVAKALWVGTAENEPWLGLHNPSGFARGAVLELCVQLRQAGCDLRLVRNLQFSYRLDDAAETQEINRLELILQPRE